ncbi:hypothetical protein [Rummeliibacillus suwonensis]|uniref:hypothetical protein n=1 Tax=Rummeliibacillus suwonensis TaxID=1306154 RepID=UPI00289AC9DA|nr:hypothetical protein [Rummeliibacillus suwonensis]
MTKKEILGIFIAAMGLFSFIVDSLNLFDAVNDFKISIENYLHTLYSLDTAEIDKNFEKVKSSDISFINAVFDMNRNKFISLSVTASGILIYFFGHFEK